MKEILKKILEEKKFSIKIHSLNGEEVLQADRTDFNGFDFLTVMFLDEEKFSHSIFNEYIEDLYNKISEQTDLKMGWDKNLSLLIVLRVKNLEVYDRIQSLIFDIEENPFMFKKYILPYTDIQTEIFTTRYTAYRETEILSFLDNILYDSKIFSMFKSKDESKDYLLYDLVSKLFIKLPFLNISNQDKEMESLIDDIIGSFSEEEKEVWIEFEELMINERSNPDIKKILESAGITNDE